MMKRILIGCLALIFLMGLCACGQTSAGSDKAPEQTQTDAQENQEEQVTQEQKEPADPEEQKEVVEKIEEEMGGPAPDADDVSWTTLKGVAQSDGILVQAKLYSILLPSDWEGKYVAEETNQWLSLYSKENLEGGYGGLLCNIVYTDDPMQYEGLPDYRILGKVTIDGVSYDVVADVMTTAQAPESGELRQQYDQMFAQLDVIFKTIDFGTNGTYEPA